MQFSFETWKFGELVEFLGSRVFFAILCGGIIGMERELKHKAAGIKTNILICVGSALFTALSLLMAESQAKQGHYGDPARLAAQIVSGVGFLGGGAIIQGRGTIIGLTTAATIWVVAAIGVCCGIGRYDIGLVSALSVVTILVLTTFFEDRILGRSISFACEIVAEDPGGQVRLAIDQALESNELLLDDFDLSAQGTSSHIKIRYRGHRNDHRKFVLSLWATPGIREVKQV
jgi:putative Mg2+ transporter-C (MgtC) family protein